VHRYGAHIFHTHHAPVWAYIRQFAEFNHYIHNVLACYKGELYNLPFNMNTFRQMWGVSTPAEAMAKLREQRNPFGNGETNESTNLEEQAISWVGRDIYEKLVKGYTEKQWGRPCAVLPAFIIRRLPLRFLYDNNYFSDPYQGIPIGGYTAMAARMLAGTEVRLGVDYIKERGSLAGLAETVVYTGAIDEYFDYRYGALEYRSLRFEVETWPVNNAQGVAVMNYTDTSVPYIRRIEHKHFEFDAQARDCTVITREYSEAWRPGEEAYYPVNDEKNQALYARYKALADAEPGVVFGGRLGTYRYLDMDDVVEEALRLVKAL
jgi:UDP-galactopyranose mutase